jgi:hypothetical protein
MEFELTLLPEMCGRMSCADEQRQIQIPVSPRNPWFRGSSRGKPSALQGSLSPRAQGLPPQRSLSPQISKSPNTSPLGAISGVSSTSPNTSPLSAALGTIRASKSFSSAQSMSLRKVNSGFDDAPAAASNVMTGLFFVEYVSYLACLLYIANFCKHACSSLSFPCLCCKTT